MEWDNWYQACEFIVREKTPEILPYQEDESQLDEKQLNQNELAALKFSDEFKLRLHMNNTKSAANLKGLLKGFDGYRIKEDIVLKKPEVVLFQSGLNAIDRQSVTVENVKIHSHNNKTYILRTNPGNFYFSITEKKGEAPIKEVDQADLVE